MNIQEKSVLSVEDSQSLPLVSLIIRTKNRLVFLEEALHSVVQQTYPKIEVIVVNDGGEDVSKIIESFNNSKVSIILAQFSTSIGRSKAANVGLDRANGEYIAFLDDDDWLDPEHISFLMNALSSNPDKEIAYSCVICVDEKKQLIGNNFCQPYDRMLLLAGNYIPIHAVLFSSAIVDSGCRMDESLDL